MDGCSVEISEDLKTKQQKIDNDVRAIMKQCKNNPIKVIEYFENHNIPVYSIKHAKLLKKFFKEKLGFITERSGVSAIALNIAIGNKLSTKTRPMVILKDEEPDIYNLIYCFHKWYAFKEGMSGFDEKSQRLLLKFNEKNEDKLIGRLSIREIEGLREAIARDVQAIDFVSLYSRENTGAKKALEKMQTDDGANI